MAKRCVFYLSLIYAVFSSGVLLAEQPAQSNFILPQYSRKVSLDFKDADLKDVLKSFSKQIGANFIVSKDVQEQKVTLLLDNVPVEEALSKVLLVNGLMYDYDEAMNLFVIKIKAVADVKLITRIYSLRYASVDSSKMKSTGGAASATPAAGGASASSASSGGLKSAISAVLSAKGKVIDDARTNSIIVTDIEENFPEVERMLALLDVPLKQVVIEVEMLDVSKNSADTVGAKFNLSANINGGSKLDFFPFDSSNVVEKYGGDPQAYTPGKIDFSASTLALDFLKSQGDTRSLARPRIITADNETATIQISTNEAIGLIDSTSSAEGAATQTQEAERVQTGVFLTVTPQVNPLTEEITLVVEPKVIDASSFSTFGGTKFYNPEERSVKVTLRVPNGKTIVIGGLLRRAASDSRTDVPFISKIPFIGAAFRHSDKSSNERELMVFLTPHVLDSDLSMSGDSRKENDRQMQLREQSFPDARSGLIDKEMDSINHFRKGL